MFTSARPCGGLIAPFTICRSLPSGFRSGFDQARRCNTLRVRASGDDDETIDIDALAARLAAEAERLRRMDRMDLGSDIPISSQASSAGSTTSGGTTDQGPSPFAFESKARELDVLANLGDGGLSASEFELLSELGSISVQQVEAPAEDIPLFSAPERSARAAVIAYTAMFYSGMPFQDPVVTLMKEYLPGAKAVACNELLVLKHLTGLPDVANKWKVAAAVLSSRPPVVELLGYFLAGPSERATLLDPTVDAASSGDTIWVVQKWENMAPLVLYPGAQQTSGLGLGRLFGQGKDAGLRDRAKMLKAIARGALNSVAYCHERAVVHGSLGSGSFLMSTFDDQASARLVIKLDNFGFAKKVVTANKDSSALYPEPQPLDDTPLALGIKDDLKQVSIVLLECILSALGAQGPSERTSADAIRRVLGEVFDWDVQQYRQYCADDPEWDAAVQYLDADDGAGWELIEELLQGKKLARELEQGSRFLHPGA